MGRGRAPASRRSSARILLLFPTDFFMLEIISCLFESDGLESIRTEFFFFFFSYRKTALGEYSPLQKGVPKIGEKTKNPALKCEG